MRLSSVRPKRRLSSTGNRSEIRSFPSSENEMRYLSKSASRLAHGRNPLLGSRRCRLTVLLQKLVAHRRPDLVSEHFRSEGRVVGLPDRRPTARKARLPRGRTGFGTGISFCSSATDRRSKVAAARYRDGDGPAARDDLEVVELHLQASPSVPACPCLRNAARPCRSAAASSTTMASKSVRSVENVFSAPTDFRIRSARTSRLSTPLEIQ